MTQDEQLKAITMLIDRHKEIWTLAHDIRRRDFEILGRLRLTILASDSSLSELSRSHAKRVIDEISTQPPPTTRPRKRKF